MERSNDRISPLPPDEAAAAKYLTFQLDDQYYGIPISDVIEIVQVQPITELPEAPAYIKGVICMRGRVIPLVDVRLRFGNQEKGYTDRTCIIVVDMDATYVGMIVDMVEDVLDIDDSLISAPPSVSVTPPAYSVTGIAKLDGYVVLLLNSRALLSDLDISLFARSAG